MLFLQRLGDSLLGADHFHRIMTYGRRIALRGVIRYKDHVEWHPETFKKWIEHDKFEDVLRRFLEETGYPAATANTKKVEILACLNSASMESTFQDVVAVIDSGGLFPHYEVDIKPEAYLDIYKFFTPEECAENSIHITSILYIKLGRIIERYARRVVKPELSSKRIHMLVTFCMILVGTGKSISPIATPWLLNALIFMSSDSNNSMLEACMRNSCEDMRQFNNTLGLVALKSMPEEKSKPILATLMEEEKKAFDNMVVGIIAQDDMYKRLRKLSIMMLGEGVIVKSDSIQLLMGEEFRGQKTGLEKLEEFLEKTRGVNGIIMVPRRQVWVWGARLYICVTLAASLYFCFGNIAKRDNWYERITDMVAGITIFWFTVFGLLKLKSDDENIIRNLAVGVKPIRHEDELIEHLKLDSDPSRLKVALSRVMKDYNWLSSRDCCFIKGQAKGSIEILGGLDADACDRAGLLEVNQVVDDRKDTGRGVVFDVINEMFGEGEKNYGRLHVTNWARSGEKWLIVNRVPTNCVVAG